jgi:tRNA-Thr(GGU) m(6)t(6)A37 methyltransferase TsaA
VDNFTLKPIGIVHSPYKEKFGIPRQPGLVNITSRVEILPPYNIPDAFDGLEEFSHIWVSFVFHQVWRESWKALVRPPRLGGNQKKGVFASRAPFRPNNLGLSVVKLESIEVQDKTISLHVSGLDCVDQTPVVDIKPYLPYVDNVPEATGGFAAKPPEPDMSVAFSPSAERQLATVDLKMRQYIIEVLSYDIRPAYRQRETTGEYGMSFDEFNIRWKIEDKNVLVIAVDRV